MLLWPHNTSSDSYRTLEPNLDPPQEIFKVDLGDRWFTIVWLGPDEFDSFEIYKKPHGLERIKRSSKLFRKHSTKKKYIYVFKINNKNTGGKHE